MRRAFITLRQALLVSAALLPGMSFAQQAAPSSPTSDASKSGTILEEVVVTAARDRKEAVQQTPLAISVITPEQLDREHITSLVGIANLTPSLDVHRAQATGDVVAIYLRGFGTRSPDPSVNPGISTYVDGVYQASTNGTDLDLFDLQSVEVLKGPQGTVLGKNSSAGAISITTKRPTGHLSAEAQVTGESFNRFEARAVVNVPIVPDVLAGKVSVLRKDGGNYVNVYDAGAFTTDPATGHQLLNLNGPHSRSMGGDNIWAVRAGLQFTPSDNFDWYVRADYNSYRNPQLPVRPYGSTSGAEVTPISSPVTLPTPLMCSVFGFCDRFPAYTSAPSFRAPLKSETDSIASIINFKTHSVVFTSVTGYRNYESSNNSDIEGLPINFLTLVDTHVKLHQFSQELRVLSQKNGGLDLGGRLDWVAGLYYFNAGYTQAQPVDVFGGAANGGVTSTSYSAEDQLSKAIFGHAEFHITDQWNVSAGVRQTWDDKTHDGIAYIGPVAPPLIDVRDNWKNFSKEFATSYMFDTSKMIYFRYAEGYRGGGMQGAPATIDAATPYQPETSRAFELGFKSDWLNHRLRVNADLYQTKYHDLQVDTYRVSVGGANLLLTQNAAAATIGGAEITTIIVPVEALTISANIGYIRARYDKFFADILGNGIVTDNSAFRFPFTPTWSGSLSVDYAVAHGAWGKLTVGGDYAYKSSQMLSLNNFPLALQSPYGVANFSLRFDRPSSRYYGVLYAQNAFDKQYLVNLEPISGNAPGAIDGMPRVFGIIVGAKF